MNRLRTEESMYEVILMGVLKGLDTALEGGLVVVIVT